MLTMRFGRGAICFDMGYRGRLALLNERQKEIADVIYDFRSTLDVPTWQRVIESEGRISNVATGSLRVHVPGGD